MTTFLYSPRYDTDVPSDLQHYHRLCCDYREWEDKVSPIDPGFTYKRLQDEANLRYAEMCRVWDLATEESRQTYLLKDLAGRVGAIQQIKPQVLDPKSRWRWSWNV